MSWKRKTSGGVLAFIGFMLSPLSWWNDLFVNVPLAVGFAWLVSLVYKPAFSAAAIVGYWLTNVLGFVLLHKGAQQTFTIEDKPYTRRSLVRDILISLLYTLLIVVLVKIGVLKPVTDYFQDKPVASRCSWLNRSPPAASPSPRRITAIEIRRNPEVSSNSCSVNSVGVASL